MLAPKRMSSIQRTVLLLVAVVVVALSFYLLYNRFFAAPSTDENLSGTGSSVNFSNIQTNFSYDFINQHPYIGLQQNADLPVRAGAIGHDNPFGKPPAAASR